MGANQAHYVKCHDTGFVLDVENGTLKSGSRIILWNQKHGADAQNQKWIIDDHGFIHVQGHDNLVLDVKGGGGKGTEVILWEKKQNDNANQKWKIEGHNIVSKATGLVLDVEGDSHKQGAHLIIYEKKHNDNDNQKFSFVKQ
eukprot:TRINITY_DN16_c0_g2_i1.p1 TRINITY_DN16_c0_g2~~TRINITY_DN16_c0_g2_i1.p1  ORF type:complete len:142 (-),score=32.57 TRINITY_DN16_c0_g2_i1:33-458(-)